MPGKIIDPPTTMPPSIEFSGKWVAWNKNHTQVLAHAGSFRELWHIVRDRQIEKNVVFEKMPRSDRIFVGKQ